jgi:hypothetical protein
MANMKFANNANTTLASTNTFVDVTTTSSPAVTYDITVAFGTKIANGKARIVQSMLMPFGRYGQLPA